MFPEGYKITSNVTLQDVFPESTTLLKITTAKEVPEDPNCIPPPVDTKGSGFKLVQKAARAL
jgi:hypothetical protein